MNRTHLRLFAVSLSLLAWGVPQVTARPTVPVYASDPPKASVTPPTSVAVDKIVSDAIAARGAAGGSIAAGNSVYLSSRVFNGLSEKRQDIDLVDVPLKEALKRVLEDAKTPYVIDEDVPSEPRVSIKLSNAPLTTILDALTLSNKIGWRTEYKRSKSAEAAAQEMKASGRPTYQSVVDSTKFETQIHVGKTVAALPSSFQVRTLDIQAPPPPGIPQYTVPFGNVPPQVLRYRWQSQKRTFTCPRCHNSISILQQPEEAKCTKCHRDFEDNWQVCPFDGTKRPERKDIWRFCPICGKTIKQETSWSVPSHFTDYYTLGLPNTIDLERIPFTTGQPMPGLWNSEGEAYYEPIPDESVIELLPLLAAPSLRELQ